MQSSSSIIPNQQPTHKSKKHNSIRRKTTLVAIIIIALSLVVGVAYFVYDKKSASNAICGDDTIKDAMTLMKERKTTELAELSNSITSKNGYEKDENCLYIATNAAIAQNNIEGGKKYYQMLVGVFNPEQGYSEQWGGQVTPPYQLEEILTFLEQSANQPVEGTYIGTPSQ